MNAGAGTGDAQQRAWRHRHWRTSLALTGVLLALWLLLILGTALYAHELNRHTFLGVPVAFYIFAQGAPITFLILISVHARLANRLDRHFAASQECDKSKK